jgi:hypothetical protein
MVVWDDPKTGMRSADVGGPLIDRAFTPGRRFDLAADVLATAWNSFSLFRPVRISFLVKVVKLAFGSVTVDENDRGTTTRSRSRWFAGWRRTGRSACHPGREWGSETGTQTVIIESRGSETGTQGSETGTQTVIIESRPGFRPVASRPRTHRDGPGPAPLRHRCDHGAHAVAKAASFS